MLLLLLLLLLLVLPTDAVAGAVMGAVPAGWESVGAEADPGMTTVEGGEFG
jgi:hypothetical protein